jgi:hypothetical protein
MYRSRLVAIALLVIALVFGVVVVAAQGPDGSGWWANFTIQNTTGSTAAVVSTAYNSANSDTHTNSVNLEGGTSVIYHPGLSANCPGTVDTASSGCRIGLSPNLGAGFSGSVVVSSDAPVVAITNLNNNQSGTVGVSGGTARSAYQGVSGSLADTTLYFPTVKNNFNGQSTMFFVQAAGSDANVTITYNMNNGSSYNDQALLALYWQLVV